MRRHHRSMCPVLGHLFPDARMKLLLIDDGTLDTLFECPDARKAKVKSYFQPTHHAGAWYPCSLQ